MALAATRSRVLFSLRTPIPNKNAENDPDNHAGRAPGKPISETLPQRQVESVSVVPARAASVNICVPTAFYLDVCADSQQELQLLHVR